MPLTRALTFRVTEFTRFPHPTDDALRCARIAGTGYTVVDRPGLWPDDAEGLFLPAGWIVPTTRAPFEALPANCDHPHGGAGHRVLAQRRSGVLSHGVLVPLSRTLREMCDRGATYAEIGARFGILQVPDPRLTAPEGPPPPTFAAPAPAFDWRDYPDAERGRSVQVREWADAPTWRIALVRDHGSPQYVVAAEGTPPEKALLARLADSTLPKPILLDAARWCPSVLPNSPGRDPDVGFAQHFLVVGSLRGETVESVRVADVYVDGARVPYSALLTLAARWRLPLVPTLYLGPYDPALAQLADRADSFYPHRNRDGIELFTADAGTLTTPRYVVLSEEFLLRT